MNSSKRLLIVGCGYVGKRVAVRAVTAGHQVYALTRSATRFEELRSLGVTPIEGVWHSAQLPQMPAVDRVLVAVPHREDADLGEETHVRGLQNLLSQLPPSGDLRGVYLSTTGVYGEHARALVNEETAPAPKRLGPKIALAAEHWLTQRLPPQFTVLRLAGIYGPERIPLAAKLRAGEPLAVPSDGCLNLVHLEDIARVIDIALFQGLEQSLYVLSDGHPIERRQFYRYLAELCGVSEPVFATPNPDETRSQRAGSKRIDPSRIVAETQFAFHYPTYREGLAALFA